ncbi:hypothetical protein KCMC57_up01170 [Kitasatospora sp. CMC57]|uniref:Uncharacterized protein n=1 Tax=Kitasatospora sp. CMC57 TaxID=3231513 RepID=A0AB33JM03_9ACTN
MAKGRITVLVTHNLADTRLADRILVVSSGRIVQEGSYDDLAADRDGLFHELLDLQFDRSAGPTRRRRSPIRPKVTDKKVGGPGGLLRPSGPPTWCHEVAVPPAAARPWWSVRGPVVGGLWHPPIRGSAAGRSGGHGPVLGRIRAIRT